MNNVILTGRITRDPEVRYTQAGVPTVNFSLAVDRQFKDAMGNRQADFINCVAWRNQADFISRYIRKGYMLCVQGRIQSRSYQGQDNQTHYVTEVICESVENMTPRQDNQSSYNQGYQQQPRQVERPSYQQPSYASNEPEPNQMTVEDDDLPF